MRDEGEIYILDMESCESYGQEEARRLYCYNLNRYTARFTHACMDRERQQSNSSIYIKISSTLSSTISNKKFGNDF